MRVLTQAEIEAAVAGTVSLLDAADPNWWVCNDGPRFRPLLAALRYLWPERDPFIIADGDWLHERGVWVPLDTPEEEAMRQQWVLARNARKAKGA